MPLAKVEFCLPIVSKSVSLRLLLSQLASFVFFHHQGAVIYVLDLFCNSSNIQVRESAAELLAKMSSDKLAGPKVKLDLSKFLPRLFSEAIRDAPKQCVHMFETKHENPELIWDEDAKAKVSRIVAELKEE